MDIGTYLGGDWVGLRQIKGLIVAGQCHQVPLMDLVIQQGVRPGRESTQFVKADRVGSAQIERRG